MLSLPINSNKDTSFESLPGHTPIQDTGLLYRAVGFKALKSSIAFDDVGPLVRLSNSLSPDDLKDPDLRGDEAAKAASQVSVRNRRQKTSVTIAS